VHENSAWARPVNANNTTGKKMIDALETISIPPPLLISLFYIPAQSAIKPFPEPRVYVIEGNDR
jgi:hypothetical protein